MAILLILGCEIIVFSFLIGAFLSSFGLGLVILGGTSLILYALFQRKYTPHPLVWGATLLASFATLLWTSIIDFWLGTTFIAILLCLLSGASVYFLNAWILKKISGGRQHPKKNRIL